MDQSIEQGVNQEHAEKPKIKICGLTRPEDIACVNRFGPDYIGFVFARKSHRFVTYDEAAALKRQLSPSIRAVGVFVDESPEVVAGLLQNQVIDLAQLHGREDEHYLRELRRLTDGTVIQAFKICSEDDLIRAQESTADYLLFDSPVAGSGTTFDWSLLQNITRPYFLAGGLNPDNVKQALGTLTPFGVDVSSGVETDRVKDKEKIRQFIQSVRN